MRRTAHSAAAVTTTAQQEVVVPTRLSSSRMAELSRSPETNARGAMDRYVSLRAQLKAHENAGRTDAVNKAVKDVEGKLAKVETLFLT